MANPTCLEPMEAAEKIKYIREIMLKHVADYGLCSMVNVNTQYTLRVVVVDISCEETWRCNLIAQLLFSPNNHQAYSWAQHNAVMSNTAAVKGNVNICPTLMCTDQQEK